MEPEFIGFMSREEASRGTMVRDLPFVVGRVRLEAVDIAHREPIDTLDLYTNLPVKNTPRRDGLYHLKSLKLVEGRYCYERQDSDFLPLRKKVRDRLVFKLLDGHGDEVSVLGCDVHLSFS